MTTSMLDNPHCEALVLLGAQGDASACRTLVEYLWPVWLEMIRSSRRMQLLANFEDGVHDVAARLVEKLGQPGARGLCLYASWKQRNNEKAFEDWLRIVTKNVIRDYVRGKAGSQRRNAGEPSVKRLLNDFASSPLLEELGCRPPITWAQTARELLEFASKRLTTQQWVVLEAWLKGASFEEIAVELNLDAEFARQTLRSAVAILRRYFTKDTASAEG